MPGHADSSGDRAERRDRCRRRSHAATTPGLCALHLRLHRHAQRRGHRPRRLVNRLRLMRAAFGSARRDGVLQTTLAASTSRSWNSSGRCSTARRGPRAADGVPRPGAWAPSASKGVTTVHDAVDAAAFWHARRMPEAVGIAACFAAAKRCRADLRDRRWALPARSDEPLRADREPPIDVTGWAMPGGRRAGPDRAAVCEHARLRAGCRAAAGAGRRRRRAVRRRGRAGPRLPAPAGADGGALRGRPVRRRRGADVPHRRPGALAGRRHARVPGPTTTGQDPRLPHRARARSRPR